MKVLCLFLVTALLAAASAAYGGVTVPGGTTLLYGAPSDLDSVVDPKLVYQDVDTECGMPLASFNALNPQVIAFNNAPAPRTYFVTTIQANYGGGMITFSNFANSGGMGWGGNSDFGLMPFSGSAGPDSIFNGGNGSPPYPGTEWFRSDISLTGPALGVSAFAICVHEQPGHAAGSNAGFATFQLSDGSQPQIAFPQFGPNHASHYVSIAYQAPDGVYITSVDCVSDAAGGYNYFLGLDDLAFALDFPPIAEPCPLALLAGGVLLMRRRKRI